MCIDDAYKYLHLGRLSTTLLKSNQIVTNSNHRYQVDKNPYISSPLPTLLVWASSQYFR